MYKKLIILAVLLLILGVGYYTISPLFRTITVNDTTPITQTASESVFLETPVELFPVIGTTGHPASGTVRLIQSPEETIIRYENFKTINGPDLFVYLSKDLEGKEFVDLGEIRGTEGNINYTIPNTVNIADYKYVMTWCKQFGVLFNYAEIPLSVTSGKEPATDTQSDQESLHTSSDTVRASETVKKPNGPPDIKTALLANGCFWCVEHDLAEVAGVTDVISGYAGGTTENPTYANYDDDGHREVVLVTYDANRVSFGNLVEHIIKHGDPTDTGGSFNDRGPYYVPAIYYEDDVEKNEAKRVIEAIDALRVFPTPLPLAVIPRVTFWPAEDYHQDYA
jgi:methionine-S-sulfoxide reductase